MFHLHALATSLSALISAVGWVHQSNNHPEFFEFQEKSNKNGFLCLHISYPCLSRQNLYEFDSVF